MEIGPRRGQCGSRIVVTSSILIAWNTRIEASREAAQECSPRR